MDAVTTALTSSFTTVANSLTSIIGDTLPIALPVVGAMIVVNIGIKVFRKVTSHAL